jgi:hypothetical protein
VLVGLVVADYPRQTMVWMCLERCKETPSIIDRNLNVIAQVVPRSLTAVSFERYDLGADSALVRNPTFTDVLPRLKQVQDKAKSLRLLPMITSVRIDYMRQVFANPKPFIDACISEARKYNYTGYNIDWEPEHGVVASDAPLYSKFIALLAQQLDKQNLDLNVDIASWSVLYNFTALAHAVSIPGRSNRVITMDTYAGSQTGWNNAFNKALTVTPRNLIGIGLMDMNPNSGQPLTLSEAEYRFNEIQKHSDLREVDVWYLDNNIAKVDSFWWNLFAKFLAN